MSNRALRERKGTTTEIQGHTLPAGMVEIDITKPTLVVHNGETAGGIPLAQASHGHANATESSPGFISAADKQKLDVLSAVGGYTIIESDGVELAQQSTLNFGPDFTAVDNTGTSATDVVISTGFRQEMTDQMVAMIIALS